jgi:ribosomal protein S18 acetylase RimI-like enzyme
MLLMDTHALVRRAAPADLELLLPLVSAYRRFYGQASDEARERRFIGKHLRDGSSTLFIAIDGERAIGFVQIYESWSTVQLAPMLVLEDLFVEEASRGKHVATSLIDAALRFAREAGAAGMFLETATDNLRAQAVYERAGWQREQRFVKYNAPL